MGSKLNTHFKSPDASLLSDWLTLLGVGHTHKYTLEKEKAMPFKTWFGLSAHQHLLPPLHVLEHMVSEIQGETLVYALRDGAVLAVAALHSIPLRGLDSESASCQHRLIRARRSLSRSYAARQRPHAADREKTIIHDMETNEVRIPDGARKLSPLEMNKLAILKDHTVITFKATQDA